MKMPEMLEAIDSVMVAPYKEYFKQLGLDWDTEVLILHLSHKHWLPYAPASHFRFSPWVEVQSYYVTKKELLTPDPFPCYNGSRSGMT